MGQTRSITPGHTKVDLTAGLKDFLIFPHHHQQRLSAALRILLLPSRPAALSALTTAKAINSSQLLQEFKTRRWHRLYITYIWRNVTQGSSRYLNLLIWLLVEFIINNSNGSIECREGRSRHGTAACSKVVIRLIRDLFIILVIMMFAYLAKYFFL